MLSPSRSSRRIVNMRTQHVDKKELEFLYLLEARLASQIFPYGVLEQQERPDFVLHSDGRTIGIEVTQLCREAPRAEAGRLAKVPAKAKEHYSQLADAQAVDVSVAFGRPEKISFNALTTSLAKFVHLHQNKVGMSFERGLPEGFCWIGIHEPREPRGCWHAPRVFDAELASRELIESRIAEKNRRLLDYRLSASEVWLLIVNDQFLGPGEVRTRSDHLANWRFDFDFEKVLLFVRQPSGSGEVLEVRRAERSYPVAD